MDGGEIFTAVQHPIRENAYLPIPQKRKLRYLIKEKARKER